MVLNAAHGMCGVRAPARPAHGAAPVVPRGGQASSLCGPSLRCRMVGRPAFAVGRQAAGSLQRRQRGAALAVRSEVSYIMIKPDGVQRGLVGEIIGRLERKGFTLRALRLRSVPRALAEEHYKDLRERPFFPDLVDYITSGPVVAMVWEGKGVVKSARKLIGATNPLEAEPGTIRGDLAVQTGRNVVHGSDSPDNGERETGLWFDGEGLVEWSPTLMPWLQE